MSAFEFALLFAAVGFTLSAPFLHDMRRAMASRRMPAPAHRASGRRADD
jgi:hypothetical protein